ncbi:hypothetical protein JVU11DRAFT_2175 [Chiua virens]|nr:hypothetical protein JVU11DRAFT_2175 [Chiua virens]
MSPWVNADLYMRFTFNIDLTKVPVVAMLVEQLANIAGKYVKSLYLFLSQAKNVFRSARQVGRAQVQQDHAATLHLIVLSGIQTYPLSLWLSG